MSARKRSGPPLSEDDIVSAALRLIDARGLDRLTMRSLALDMGIYPTSLYWHAGSKAKLLASVASRVFEEVVLPDEHDLGWEEWLSEVARRVRTAMHRHPEIARVSGSLMVTSVIVMPIAERIVGVLERAGFRDSALVPAYNTYVGFMLGWTTLELSAEPTGEAGDWKSEFAAQLRNLEPNAYPALRRNMERLENQAFLTRYDSGRRRPMDDSFASALKVLVDGLRAQL